MPNSFTFGSVTSSSLNVFISGSGVLTAPERAYDFISVPGRDGDILGYEKRLENVSITYPCFFHSSLVDKAKELKSKLLSVIGYATLSDTYDTDHFRKAVFVGGTQFKPTQNLEASEFDLTFNCKPQKWLNSGTQKTTLTANGSISNPTQFASQPLITVTGYGEIYIGSKLITITNVFTDITIDCEMGDCYHGTENGNAVVQLQGNEFPTLLPGTNNITFDNTITKVEITPRWFDL